MNDPTEAVVVTGLTKQFRKEAGLFGNSAGLIQAVAGVSFRIRRGQTLGLVGESGSGKTTTARLLLRIYEPDAGSMRLGDMTEDFFSLNGRRLRQARLGMQYIFQDPYGSLNPKLQVRRLVTEPVEAARRLARQAFGAAERDRLAAELCRMVGLQAGDINRYAHEFSGGQRQRLAIARALSVRPSLIICDEPVSSLDVSIQSQILNLLNDLQKSQGIAYLFIGHNLPVVFYVSDEVAVMYAGRIVEQGPARLLAERPLHPYTRELKAVGDGVVGLPVSYRPNQSQSPPACPFFDRCPLRSQRCLTELPVLRPAGQPDHLAACHHAI